MILIFTNSRSPLITSSHLHRPCSIRTNSFFLFIISSYHSGRIFKSHLLLCSSAPRISPPFPPAYAQVPATAAAFFSSFPIRSHKTDERKLRRKHLPDATNYDILNRISRFLLIENLMRPPSPVSPADLPQKQKRGKI